MELDNGRELIPRGRGEVQLCAEELALGVEDVEVRGETPLVAESSQRERPARRRHAALALRADLPNLAVEDQGGERELGEPRGRWTRTQEPRRGARSGCPRALLEHDVRVREQDLHPFLAATAGRAAARIRQWRHAGYSRRFPTRVSRERNRLMKSR